MAQVAHASQPASQAPKPPGAAGALTVLVVDDSNLCRELVVEALRSHGYSTLSAADGKLGIDQLQSHRVDAVILDNEMPNMNGMTFLKTVRADQRWSELPIVMLTTNTSKELIVEAMNHKVNGYLVKAKFSMTEMFSRVRTRLRARSRCRGSAAASGGSSEVRWRGPRASRSPATGPAAAATAATHRQSAKPRGSGRGFGGRSRLQDRKDPGRRLRRSPKSPPPARPASPISPPSYARTPSSRRGWFSRRSSDRPPGKRRASPALKTPSAPSARMACAISRRRWRF